jgi:hypothetical protein
MSAKKRASSSFPNPGKKQWRTIHGGGTIHACQTQHGGHNIHIGTHVRELRAWFDAYERSVALDVSRLSKKMMKMACRA